MTLAILREDALTTTADGLELRIALPWIRSLPIASLRDVRLALAGVDVEGIRVRIDDRLVALDDLGRETGWWFLQDRVALVGGPSPDRPVEVAVSFTLAVPYLHGGPDGPLTLQFRETARLVPGAVASTPAPAPVAPAVVVDDDLPAEWTLVASAFNWTPDVVRADRPADEVLASIISGGTARVIEVEPGQVWRSFPEPTDAEVDATRTALEAVGGSVSIVGGSFDDYTTTDRRRSDDERYEFVLPQIRAAARLGATGIRFPLGHAGEHLLRRLVPVLHELEITLFEEAQGQQTPTAAEASYAAIAAIDDPRVRVLLDISMLMPAVPTTYLERLRRGGLDPDLVARIENDWRDPATQDAVMAALRGGQVPPSLLTLYMDMVVRFGRSAASDLRPILPLVSGFHLKFWDLVDDDGRVSQPIRDLGAELATADFAGTLCSEWGGLAWLDDDPAAMTRAHLALARQALAAGVATRA